MALYAVTIFTAAFLLFQVQPLMGKYILPWFGGSPGVWTTCLLFFQVLLLGGYAYAHFISRRLKPRAQVIVHLLLLGGALALLPITPRDSWKPLGGGNPTLQILALLAVNLALPYLVLSATGPLLQQWFSRTHPGASPYRLYALSNAGSLLALLSYPFYFETHFTRKTQAVIWGWGLGAYAIGCALCALNLWGREVSSQWSAVGSGGPAVNALRTTDHRPRTTHGLSRPSALDRLLWLLLPACASALLLATTNKICQDVAVIPFLWVLPLALYLLSFVICFDSPRWYRRLPFGLALAAASAGIWWVLSAGFGLSILVQLSLYSVGLFVCSMVCHGELYRLRPDPQDLTGFYLMVAAGGALGGVFVAVVAPLVFTAFFELDWGLVCCGGLFLLVWLRDPHPGVRSRWRWPACIGWSAGLVALGLALWHQAHNLDRLTVSRSRNFYGVLSVLKDDPSGSSSSCLQLMHGTTFHGLQFLDPALAEVPTGYYTENSGVGLAMRALPGAGRRIGLVGLGTGTLAAYARPSDFVRIYEINPEVIRLATSRFTFLTHCKAAIEVALGDARISLENEPQPQQFDLLVLDAFSGDAIPVHLLTEEAFALYGRHLKTNGIIAVHISNNYVGLGPVVANLARRFDYQAVTVDQGQNPDTWWIWASAWMLLSHNEEILRSPPITPAARLVSAGEQFPLWTDDFASLFPILRWQKSAQMQPRLAETQAGIASGLAQKGDFAGAIARYRVALQLEPYFAEALNNLGWLLATAPDPRVRNGSEAVQLAERACALADYRRTLMVGTLAAAYAEAGRFPEAVAAAERACALASEAGDDVLLTKNRELLALYRAQQPYHAPPAPATP